MTPRISGGLCPTTSLARPPGCPAWSFTTPANPILITTFPYTENLDGVTRPALPAGWTVGNGATDNGAQWATGADYARSRPNAMEIRTYSAMDDWFFSPPLQLSAGTTYAVEFYYRAVRGDRNEQMEVSWGTAPSPAGMTGGQIWSNSGFKNTTYARGLTAAITPGTTGLYYVGWHATSPHGEGIHVDDIGVGIPPSSCAGNPLPADGATGVSRNADLSWSAAARASGYKLYFGTDNPPTNLANGVDLGNVTTYDPGSMPYEARHYWRIVPYNAYGEAVGCPAWSFTTEANPVLVTTFPYTENFDGVTAPALPDGWVAANGATANAGPVGHEYRSPSLGPNAMAISYDPDNAMDDWFFSPPLQLTAGRPYQVEFYRRAQNGSDTERLEVLWGTAPTAAGMTGGQIWSGNFSSTSYSQQTTSIITPAASGVYFIGWHGTSLADRRGIYVDDISVAPTFDCPTNPTPADGATGVDLDANLRWNAAVGAIDLQGLPWHRQPAYQHRQRQVHVADLVQRAHAGRWHAALLADRTIQPQWRDS